MSTCDTLDPHVIISLAIRCNSLVSIHGGFKHDGDVGERTERAFVKRFPIFYGRLFAVAGSHGFAPGFGFFRRVFLLVAFDLWSVMQ